MKKMISFFKDEEGATAVEYGLIIAVICLGILVAVQGLRTWLNAQFNNVAAIVP